MASFCYAPPAAKQVELLKEIAELGGITSTRLGKCQTYVLYVNTNKENPKQTTVQQLDNNSLQLTEPSESSNASQHVFNFSGAFCSSMAAAESSCRGVAQAPLDLWMDGFNSSIVTLGQTGTGKTHMLFGSSSSSEASTLSILDWALNQAFARLQAQADAGGAPGRIAISCADVHGNELHDLLSISSHTTTSAPHQHQGGQGAPTFVEVASYQEARHVLHAARACSANWAPTAAAHPGIEADGSPLGAPKDRDHIGCTMRQQGMSGLAREVQMPALVPLPGRAHTLVRLLLRQGGSHSTSGVGGGRGARSPGHNNIGTESCFSILDMVGSWPLALQVPSAGSTRCKGTPGFGASSCAGGGKAGRAAACASEERERRVLSQHQAAVMKLIGDLASRQDNLSGEARPVHVRDCKLTQILAPMLAGNTQATLLAAVSSAPEDYQDALNTLRTATRASTIKTCLVKAYRSSNRSNQRPATSDSDVSSDDDVAAKLHNTDSLPEHAPAWVPFATFEASMASKAAAAATAAERTKVKQRRASPHISSCTSTLRRPPGTPATVGSEGGSGASSMRSSCASLQGLVKKTANAGSPASHGTRSPASSAKGTTAKVSELKAAASKHAHERLLASHTRHQSKKPTDDPNDQATEHQQASLPDDQQQKQEHQQQLQQQQQQGLQHQGAPEGDLFGGDMSEGGADRNTEISCRHSSSCSVGDGDDVGDGCGSIRDSTDHSCGLDSPVKAQTSEGHSSRGHGSLSLRDLGHPATPALPSPSSLPCPPDHHHHQQPPCIGGDGCNGDKDGGGGGGEDVRAEAAAPVRGLAAVRARRAHKALQGGSKSAAGADASAQATVTNSSTQGEALALTSSAMQAGNAAGGVASRSDNCSPGGTGVGLQPVPGQPPSRTSSSNKRASPKQAEHSRPSNPSEGDKPEQLCFPSSNPSEEGSLKANLAAPKQAGHKCSSTLREEGSNNANLADPKQVARSSRPSTPSKGDKPRLSYAQLHAPQARASCLDTLTDINTGPKGSDPHKSGSANGGVEDAMDVGGYSSGYSAKCGARPQSAPPARPVLLDPKAMRERPTYPAYARLGWVGPERKNLLGSGSEEQGCGQEAMPRQVSSPRHAATTYMHQLAAAGAPLGCGGSGWGGEGGWRGLSGVGRGGGAINTRSPSPMRMGGKQVGGEWVGGNLTSPLRRASHPKPWNYRVGGCCEPRPHSADSPSRVRAHRSSSSPTFAASTLRKTRGSPGAARATAVAPGGFGSLSPVSRSGPSSWDASPCSCSCTNSHGRCHKGCSASIHGSKLGRSGGARGMGSSREHRARSPSCASKLHLGQEGGHARSSDLLPDQDSSGVGHWASKYCLCPHRAEQQQQQQQQKQQQQRPHAKGMAALGQECCRMGDLVDDVFLQQQQEVPVGDHSWLAEQQRLQAALDKEDAGLHSAVQASARRYRRAERNQQKQERLTRMLMEEQLSHSNRSASASEEQAGSHTTQSVTATVPASHCLWPPAAQQRRLHESDAAAVASATLHRIKQRLRGSSSPSSDQSDTVLHQAGSSTSSDRSRAVLPRTGSCGAVSWASDSNSSGCCNSRSRGSPGRHDSGGCTQANAGLEAALRRRQQRSQLQMLEDQSCSDLPHHFPSHPSKHGQYMHSQEPDTAASLGAGLDPAREGEGPQELEGRVRILLGVLERERRGREEEQQQKRELEGALEETQASSQLQACDLQAEIVQLRQRVARLQSDHPAQLGPLFEMYERDMARADAANKDLAETNSSLSSKVADLEVALAVASTRGGSALMIDPGFNVALGGSLADPHGEKAKELRKQIRALEGRVAGLVCEIGEAQRSARAHALAARQAELGLRFFNAAITQAAQAEDDSIAAGLKAAEARGQLQSMEMSIERSQEENAMLRQRVKALQLAARSNLQ